MKVSFLSVIIQVAQRKELEMEKKGTLARNLTGISISDEVAEQLRLKQENEGKSSVEVFTEA